MSRVKVDIIGIDELLYKFDNVAKIKLTDTVNKATAVVQSQAKVLAPVDTGNLRGSIHMEVKQMDNLIQGRVYTNVKYAPFVEFGTGVKGNGTYPYKPKGVNLTYRNSGWCYWSDKEDKLIYTTGQVAQPYMYPAVKQCRNNIKAIMKSGLNDELKKIIGG